ncbi:hypothetical protein O71_15750 [Pontibacter sp. BAB1700]|nr:hypothetical protein O71_15750 [Pontibacter sp. BAB1700]
MSKNELNTYQFPIQMQREFHLLMNSKENFLRKLTSAEQRKLEALYEALESVWNQNRTKILKQELETRYQELRKIQLIIKSDCKDFKTGIERQLQQSIQSKSEELMSKKKLFEAKKSDYEKMQSERKKTIEGKRQSLTEQQEFLISTSQQQSEGLVEIENLLKREKERLSLKKSQLTEISQLRKEELNKLEQLQAVYQSGLKNLKAQLEASLNSLKEKRQQVLQEYERQESNYQADLNEKESNLKNDLQDYETQLLGQLKAEILQQVPTCPEDLKIYLMQEDYSQISKSISLLIAETEKLGNALTRELTKIGKTKEEFMELMDRNTSNV